MAPGGTWTKSTIISKIAMKGTNLTAPLKGDDGKYHESSVNFRPGDLYSNNNGKFELASQAEPQVYYKLFAKKIKVEKDILSCYLLND
jgi:hypothetical protein